MQAYEFFAKPQDGIIRIPEEYRSRITTNVKVIILESVPHHYSSTQEEFTDSQKSDMLLPPTLDTTNWKFSREEANAG